MVRNTNAVSLPFFQGTIPTSLGRFKPVFSEEQEDELAEHVRDLDKRFYGLRMKDVMSLAYQYATLNRIPHRFNDDRKMAGRHWIRDFAKRQHLSMRTLNLKQCYQKSNLLPHRIFNMDETGLSTVPNRLPKVFAPKGKKTVSKVVSAERGQLITSVCCMSASGIWVPPALIFPRKRMKEELFYGAPPGTLKLISDSGYMNRFIFRMVTTFFCVYKAIRKRSSYANFGQPCFPLLFRGRSLL